MENPLISVIVPVFNVEKYLERCVKSLVNQTYFNIEIILVDDGSKDNSGVLCDAIQKSDNRIKVIHKENGGASSARNAGLKAAVGNYITFLDSDDWIELHTYQYCIGLMKKYQADTIEFDTIMVKDEQPISQRQEKVEVYEEKAILQHYLFSSTKSGSYSVCRCLFPRDAILELSFREGKINEDIDFKYLALSKCKKLVVTNQYLYHYFQSGNSVSIGGLKKRDFDLYEASEILYTLTSSEKYGDIAFLGKVKKARTAFSLLCKIAYCGIDDKSIEKRQLLKRLKREHIKNVPILLRAPLSLSRKVLVIMFAISYGITACSIRIAKKVI